jgi:hypothetical protein
MGSFEENYSEDTLRAFTEKERAQLWELYSALDAKFDEIAALMARELGCSEAQAREEAEQAAEGWDEPELEVYALVNSPIRRLLRVHHEISKAIFDIRDSRIPGEPRITLDN